MNSPNLLLVKKVLTSLTLSAAKALLDEVLQLETAQEVKRRTDEALTEAGLGQLIRVRR